MEKLNDLVLRAESAQLSGNNFIDKVKPIHILAIADAFRALEQRAEAAEAKLAELARRPPVGNFYEDGPGNWWQIGPHDKVPHVTPLFDRPAPAADLVPEGWKMVPVEPTEEMIAAGDQFMDGLSRLSDAYDAMLAAAPEVE